MSLRDIQARKAATISLDDDDAAGPVPSASAEPRTVPGKLMNLQGKYAQALDEIEELKKTGGGAGPVKVRISEIYEVLGRKRHLTADERAELKANLEQHPLINPITVRPRNDRGYELIAGHNRKEIYEELGHEWIDAVVQDFDDQKADLLAFYSNLLSPSLPDYEKFIGFKKRQLETGFSQKELADESGISPKTLTLVFSFEKLPEEARTMLDQHPQILGGSAARQLAEAVSAGRGKRVIEAVERLAAGEPGFTQAAAVAYANKIESASAPRPPKVVVRSGKQQFCQLEARNNVIAIRFADATVAAEWLKKLEEFVKKEIKPTE